MVPTLQAAKTLCEISGWTVSNLPMQKMLYVAQMVHLGRYGEPLIDGQFEAWDYGPVEPVLYHKAKVFGDRPVADFFVCPALPPETREYETLAYVYDKLKNAPVGYLISMTHWPGGAWAKHYRPELARLSIPNTDILEEYHERVQAPS